MLGHPLTVLDEPGTQATRDDLVAQPGEGRFALAMGVRDATRASPAAHSAGR